MYKEWNELSEKEQLLQYISDEHKRAYGSRPRGGYDHLSADELKVELDKLNTIANEVYEQEQLLAEEKADEFEALVTSIQHSGADTRATALTWLLSSADVGEDFEFFVYQHGFLFTDRGRALVQELKELCA
tara:strand:+ start:246 stop:638 length:393 start_codon:yes stop_codon:yes gene_type:complete